MEAPNISQQDALIGFKVTRLAACLSVLGTAILFYKAHYVLGSLAVIGTLILAVTTAFFWDWADPAAW